MGNGSNSLTIVVRDATSTETSSIECSYNIYEDKYYNSEGRIERTLSSLSSNQERRFATA